MTDLVRKSPQRLTFGAEAVIDSTPVWSLDGRIAFRRLEPKGTGIYIVDTKDISKSQFVQREPSTLDSWSQGGKYLLAHAGGEMRLLPLTADQKAIRVGSSKGRSVGGRISADGKSIAFTSNASGQSEIYVQPMPPDTGQPQQVSFRGGSNPRWRRNGKELFFVSLDGHSIMAVDVRADGTFSEPHRLFEIKDAAPSDVADYDVSPDGQQFLIYIDPKGAQDAPITVVLNWWSGLQQQP
jgi:Tol biopolymer transport system component